MSNVVPNRAHLTSPCNEAAIIDVKFYVHVAKGRGRNEIVASIDATATTVSSANTGTQRRLSGRNYIVNLSTKESGFVIGYEYTTPSAWVPRGVPQFSRR